MRKSLLAVAVASFALAGLATPPSAQTLSADAARFGAMWEFTEARCQLALNDPLAYANTLSQRDPRLTDEISISEDGTYAIVRHVVNGFAEEFWFSDIGPTRKIECSHFLHDVEVTDDPNTQSAAWAAAVRSYMATRPEFSLHGGAIAQKDAIFKTLSGEFTSFHFNLYPDLMPGARIQAVAVDMLPTSYIVAEIALGDLPTVAELFGMTATASTTATTGAPVIARPDVFALAVQICLAHMRDKSPAETFRANGFAVTPMDEGTFSISAPGVSGFLAPLLPLEWCWLQSNTLNQREVANLVVSLAQQAYPNGVSGPAQRGELANGCPSSSVLYSSTRISLLEFRNTGARDRCEDHQPGGVLFR